MMQRLETDLLRRWDELEFEDFLGSKVAIIDIDGEDGVPGSAIVMAIEYAPDFYVAAHRHATGHVEVILEGSLQVGDHWERPGDMRVVPANCSYGPLQAGPEGCKGLEFFPDRRAVLPTVDNPDEQATRVGDAADLRLRLEKLLKLS